MTTTIPEITVHSDYDGVFESWVRSWIKRKADAGGEFRSKEITISAGPYRSYAVSFERRGDVLHLDFYSALRAGFGSISSSEVDEIIELL